MMFEKGYHHPWVQPESSKEEKGEKKREEEKNKEESKEKKEEDSLDFVYKELERLVKDNRLKTERENLEKRTGFKAKDILENLKLLKENPSKEKLKDISFLESLIFLNNLLFIRENQIKTLERIGVVSKIDEKALKKFPLLKKYLADFPKIKEKLIGQLESREIKIEEDESFEEVLKKFPELRQEIKKSSDFQELLNMPVGLEHNLIEFLKYKLELSKFFRFKIRTKKLRESLEALKKKAGLDKVSLLKEYEEKLKEKIEKKSALIKEKEKEEIKKMEETLEEMRRIEKEGLSEEEIYKVLESLREKEKEEEIKNQKREEDPGFKWSKTEEGIKEKEKEEIKKMEEALGEMIRKERKEIKSKKRKEEAGFKLPKKTRFYPKRKGRGVKTRENLDSLYQEENRTKKFEAILNKEKIEFALQQVSYDKKKKISYTNLDGRCVLGMLKRANIDISSLKFLPPEEIKNKKILSSELVYQKLIELGYLSKEKVLDKIIDLVKKIKNENYPYFKKPEFWQNSYRTILGLERFIKFDDLYKFFQEGRKETDILSEEELKKFHLLKASREQKKNIEHNEKELEKIKKNGFLIPTRFGDVIIDLGGKLRGGQVMARAYGYGGYCLYNPRNQSYFIRIFNKEIDFKLKQGNLIKEKGILMKAPDGKRLKVKLRDIIEKLTSKKYEPEKELKKYLEEEKKLDDYLQKEEKRIYDISSNAIKKEKTKDIYKIMGIVDHLGNSKVAYLLEGEEIKKNMLYQVKIVYDSAPGKDKGYWVLEIIGSKEIK